MYSPITLSSYQEILYTTFISNFGPHCKKNFSLFLFFWHKGFSYGTKSWRGQSFENSMSTRFLPSLGQLRRASRDLPDPDNWPNSDYSVPVDEKKRDYELVFRKVKFSSRNNGKVSRWVYEGKIMIPTE